MAPIRSLFRGRSREQVRSRVTRDEAFRVLRSNLLVALADLRNPIVVVTSALAGEGKTTTSGSLALSLAAAGQRTVLVDLDFRHPDAHNIVGGHNEAGAADALTGRIPLEDCLQFVEAPSPNGRGTNGLYFLAAGTGVVNPTELLAGPGTARMLDVLSGQADVVLVDTPPVLPVADTLVVGRYAAGALLVVQSGRTTTPVINRAKGALTHNQTRILGVVLNMMDPADRDFQYGYGGYGYGEISGEPAEE